MVILGVIEKNVNEPLGGVHDHNRHEKRDCALSIHGKNLQHLRLAGLKINATMNVEAVATTGLCDSNFGALGAQHPAGRASCVGCTASANITASSSAKLFKRSLYALINVACSARSSLRGTALGLRYSMPIRFSNLMIA